MPVNWIQLVGCVYIYIWMVYFGICREAKYVMDGFDKDKVKLKTSIAYVEDSLEATWSFWD